ncbi:MAG: response regulator [Planctomycetes bacterium]|nr:response regulator [Planctomycetota bacterium]
MKTILYVHDKQGPPNATASYLQMAGYQVELCDSGEACLMRIKQGGLDLVLMDVLIEGKNGFDLCRLVRKQIASDQLPVILASGIYRSRIYREEAMQAGAQLYLLKPFQQHELVQVIHELLDVHACLLSSHQATQDTSQDIHRPAH